MPASSMIRISRCGVATAPVAWSSISGSVTGPWRRQAHRRSVAAGRVALLALRQSFADDAVEFDVAPIGVITLLDTLCRLWRANGALRRYGRGRSRRGRRVRGRRRASPGRRSGAPAHRTRANRSARSTSDGGRPRPPRRRGGRPARRGAPTRWCVEYTTPDPPATSSPITVRILCWLARSSPVIGSSSSNSRGEPSGPGRGEHPLTLAARQLAERPPAQVADLETAGDQRGGTPHAGRPGCVARADGRGRSPCAALRRPSAAASDGEVLLGDERDTDAVGAPTRPSDGASRPASSLSRVLLPLPLPRPAPSTSRRER